MLVSFSVANFLSFKDRQTLEMSPEPLKEYKEFLHIPYLYDPQLYLLKSVGIYGHNSHGKTNFIRAYKFFIDFIFKSFVYGTSENFIDFENFRLSTTTKNKPSFFEATFIIRDTKYRYGFEVTNKRVVSEWLFYSEPKIRENNLFLRGEQDTKVSKNWNKLSDNRVEQSLLFTKSYHLLLSVLIAQENISRIDSIESWFRSNIIVLDLSDESHIQKAAYIIYQSNFQDLVNKFISNADLGFVSIHEKIESHAGKKMSLEKGFLDLWYAEELKVFQLYSPHDFYDENHKKIGTEFFELLKHESAGTIKYFILACYLAYAINKGQLIIIDEIDSKFHSLLLEFILLTYNDPKVNIAGSQMIFTTHNTILLNNKLFRRDQFLVVERNEYGESSLRKMHTAKTPVRSDVPMEKQYIRGKLGGISKKLSSGSNQSTLDF